MAKKASPRPERDHKVVKHFVRTLEAVNATRRKMESAKKAVDYASALCEKHPKPETLAASKLAFNDYRSMARVRGTVLFADGWDSG